MSVPRTGFRRGLDDLYDYLDTEIPLGLPRSHDVIFVHSGTGTNDVNHGSFESPLATLDYAIGRTVADRGTTIMVKEGHAETITGIGGIAADVANVRIIGLGTGRQRPRFLMDAATTVTAAISAANVMMSNLRFASGHAAVVTCLDVTAAGAILDSLEFLQNTTSENFLTCIKSTSTVDETAAGLQVNNCFMYQVDSGTLEFIELNADVTGFICRNNIAISEGTSSQLVLCATGKDLKGTAILWNYLSHKMTSGNLFITNDTASANNAGIIAHNRCRHADVTGAHTMGAVGGCGFFDNLSSSTDAVSGFVLPAIDVDL